VLLHLLVNVIPYFTTHVIANRSIDFPPIAKAE